MLHDVSKLDTNRILNIRPNAADALPPESRMAHDTTQITYVDDTDTEGQGVSLKNGKIEVVESSNTIFRAGFNDTAGANKAEAARPGDTL